jgi:hypothetical protein
MSLNPLGEHLSLLSSQGRSSQPGPLITRRPGQEYPRKAVDFPPLTARLQISSKIITMETKARQPSPKRKITSAILSYSSDFCRQRIEAYEKIHEARKRIISNPRTSSMIVLFDILESLIKPSKTKQNPKRLEAVGSICWAIFFLSMSSAI